MHEKQTGPQDWVSPSWPSEMKPVTDDVPGDANEHGVITAQETGFIFRLPIDELAFLRNCEFR